MNNFFQFLLHFIFIATFLFVFIVAIIILRPFRIHRKRKTSTILLKLSYLAYLLVFLTFVYLILFYTRNAPPEVEELSNPTMTLYYIVVLLAFFIPNIGIMIRRRIRKGRSQYNWVMSIINFIFVLALFLIMNQIEWTF